MITQKSIYFFVLLIKVDVLRAEKIVLFLKLVKCSLYDFHAVLAGNRLWCNILTNQTGIDVILNMLLQSERGAQVGSKLYLGKCIELALKT